MQIVYEGVWGRYWVFKEINVKVRELEWGNYLGFEIVGQTVKFYFE